MGYPGDNDQPPWDNTPLETDPWSRHPLSAPVPQQPSEDQEKASWHGGESGVTGWGSEPQPPAAEQPGSWLESAAAPPQPPAAPEWAESQPSWGDDPLSAPASFPGQGTGANATFTDSSDGFPGPGTGANATFTDSSGGFPEPGQAGWPESPSGPQATPWEDAPQQAFEQPPTGTHALPVYDPQSYDAHEPQDFSPQDFSKPGTGGFETPSGPLSAQPYEAPGGTQAFPPYEPPAYEPSPYEAPEGSLASQPFTGAQSLSPQPAAWPEQQGFEQPHDQQPQGFEQQPYDQQQPYDGRSGPQQMPGGLAAQPPHGGYTGPQPAVPWQPQGNDGFGPGEQWNGDGTPPGGEGRGKGGRKPLIIGGALVVAVALAAGVVLLQGEDEPKKNASNSSSQVTTDPKAGDGGEPTASAQPSDAPVAEGGLLRSRKTDPKPLSLGEVFRKKKFTEKGISYVMSTRKKASCKESVHGTALQAALTKGKCTQFLRATFATAGGKMIGTVGVANLASASAAAKAAKAATAKDAYVIAVPGKGVTSKIGQGDALGAAWSRGHYLIMTWVQLPDGKAIPAKHKKAAQTFAQSTVTGSNLGPALHIRDETGKPGR
ncbi:hypothetical protein [Actinocorallia populi]|uniref:hypothetical protein n=1 Tax=Actinocorallia populi TaxID=2079200 RepID=UPI0013002888|nr:hypothetical protein [Actinocorallia populi]